MPTKFATILKKLPIARKKRLMQSAIPPETRALRMQSKTLLIKSVTRLRKKQTQWRTGQMKSETPNKSISKFDNLHPS